MPKQTLVIDSKAELSIKNGLLSIVREGKEEVFRSFEDIQTILIVCIVAISDGSGVDGFGFDAHIGRISP